MPMLRNSSHFVPKDELLLIDGETNFQEVYKQLNEAGQGGFILVEKGVPQTYVKAYALADMVVHRAVKEISKMTDVSADTYNEMLIQHLGVISNTPIKYVIREVNIVVPIHQSLVDVYYDDEQLLQDQDDRVFNVYEAGESVGWYLNHELVFNTTTEKPTFVCGNGHENPDTDHGKCYSCGLPISDTSKKAMMYAY